MVEISDERGNVGRGEAAGVIYRGETCASMREQLELLDASPLALDRVAVASLLPAGGARNAVDCALWDLEAKSKGIRASKLAGRDEIDLRTHVTISLGSQEDLDRRLDSLQGYEAFKVKLDREAPVERVAAVRDRFPDSSIIVDVNEGWTFSELRCHAKSLHALGVRLIEQPLPRGDDAALDGYSGPIPISADESCMDRATLADVVGKYQFVTIKLDKTGGLTEAMLLAAEAKSQGLGLMIGCMAGTSLAMAPAYIVGLECEFVDLDGPLLHSNDRPNGIRYDLGVMRAPSPDLWG